MSRFPPLGVHLLARSLVEIHFEVLRARGVRERNKKLVRYCDLALNGSERARVAVARFMLTGDADSRPGKFCDDT